MIMEVLNMKVELRYDEEQKDFDIKLEKPQDDSFTIANTTRKADYVEEKSLQTVLKVDMIKEEKEDNYDGSVVKTEKTEQHGVLVEDDIISMFSTTNDDDLDSSNCNDMNVKMKTEFQEEIDSVLGSTIDTNTSVNVNCVSQCPGYHGIKQEDYYAEVIKSSKPNNEICVETTLNGNNIKEFETLDKLTQEQRIQPGEKPYHCAVDVQNFERNSPLEQHKRSHTRKKFYSCGICGKSLVSNRNLKLHQRIHTERSLTVVLCVGNNLEQKMF
ncbi:uncharacterized protein LOC143234271 [Tachypleus tridentatus]|uniref:uncharacterized protein LOC143234271 n=1 Tax=Tachypleus tridentatus TaxID=6853 RepID=UPI003FD36E02